MPSIDKICFLLAPLKTLLAVLAVAGGVLATVLPARAGNASEPLGEPVLEPPTLLCLGAYWIIRGDDNTNATVQLHYRLSGARQWQRGMNLFRVEKGANKLARGASLVNVPADAWLFAGSLMLLAPDTEYELKLTLFDPDGGTAETALRSRTMAEPVAPKDSSVRHVVPGDGGGSGSLADPFRGLAAAQAQAMPGDLFLLHKGAYPGTFSVTKSGGPGKPIIWRGTDEGQAVIDAQSPTKEPSQRAIAASDLHDVWFEKLTIRNAVWGLVAHNSQRVVVRRCHFHDVSRGITATRNTDGRLGGLFIADNLLEGPFAWAAARHGASVEEYRGIEISGSGNVVCHNRVRGFKDGIDMFPSRACVASDVHHNEVTDCLDDGCEMDGSERNNRCFLNRFCNVFQGISVQPVYGGPIYVFRNALFNVEQEVFKMHNSPSGALFIHNTSVKTGTPLMLQTRAAVRNCLSRNNLFIGTEASYAFESTAPMRTCDFDYDGFGGGPWSNFLKWNQVRYRTIEEAGTKAPAYRHAVRVDPKTLFASGIQPPEDRGRHYELGTVDLRLRAGSPAIDAGELLPGFNDDYAGKAPDLGAYEYGSPLPPYGPRPEP